VCGSVFGLLRIEEACTYWPPTCEMTLAYSFSAPIATIFAAGAAADEPPLAVADAADDADDDEQALASSAAASGSATARAPVRVRMIFELPG
jgi:hypothetical protein